MSQSDVREVTAKATVRKKRRFDQRDFATISEYVTDTLDSRKQARKDREKLWKDIDRQVEMTPDISHKLDANGRPDPNLDWMPELELPLQAQTLEMLTADARRMLFPTSGSWYEPHGALTDDYLARVDMQSLILGDSNELPSLITQDNADKLVEGILDHWHRQYDFFGHIDQINAEAFKYGLGMGRARLVSKRVFLNTSKGVVKLDQKIPVLVPVSVRNTYMDDSQHRLMNEGHMIGPSVIREWHQLLSDLVLAARKGSNDPNSENGGWMPDKLSGIDAEKDGTVRVIEMEGDFSVGRKTTTDIYIPNAVVTVVLGRKGKEAHNQVIRLRYRKYPFASCIPFPYHQEDMDSAYASSPLMKGHPIQKAAVDALSRLVEAGALNTQPPIKYDGDDMHLAAIGGPKPRPRAMWPTVGNIETVEIGDPAALFQVYIGLLNQYAEVTGITAPRLGQQTVSHTTAFAKEAELSRGTVRTVDYVRSTLKSALTEWLYMAYHMGRDSMKSTPVYIDAYNGWVEIGKSELPDFVAFEVHGSGGPAEEQAKQQQRLESLQLAMQMDFANQQAGGQPKLDLDRMIEHVLSKGGWTDVDTFIRAQGAIEATPPGVANLGILAQGTRSG